MDFQTLSPPLGRTIYENASTSTPGSTSGALAVHYTSMFLGENKIPQHHQIAITVDLAKLIPESWHDFQI